MIEILQEILPVVSVIATAAIGGWVAWGKTQRDADIADLSARLDALQQENDMLRNRVSHLEQENDALRAQLEQTQAERLADFQEALQNAFRTRKGF